MLSWNPDLATGVPEIDLQHEELFRRAEAADASLCDGRAAGETQALLSYLLEYCATHFETERRLMHAFGYPRAPDHLAEHAWFTQSLRALQRDALQGGAEAVAMRLNELVLGWLVKHIASTDRALAGFLRGCQAASVVAAQAAARPA